MFQKILIDLGTISHNEEYTIVFPYENIHQITQTVASCGCSRVYNKALEQQIVVIYKPNPVPQHLANKGYYSVSKHIDVSYIKIANEETKTIRLTFSAVVK